MARGSAVKNERKGRTRISKFSLETGRRLVRGSVASGRVDEGVVHRAKGFPLVWIG
jgi:hypothetical protein